MTADSASTVSTGNNSVPVKFISAIQCFEPVLRRIMVVVFLNGKGGPTESRKDRNDRKEHCHQAMTAMLVLFVHLLTS